MTNVNARRGGLNASISSYEDSRNSDIRSVTGYREHPALRQKCHVTAIRVTSAPQKYLRTYALRYVSFLIMF